MIDKEQLSDSLLSEKDIIQDKDNSIINKSFSTKDFNFPDLIEKKNFLQIKLKILELYIQVASKSIKRIISLISDNNKDLLENNYLDYITCIVVEVDELDKQNLLNSDANAQINLEPTFYELLKKTKKFYIDIPKLNLDKKINDSIFLKSNSLEKISSFLHMDIFGMSDYIQITILSYQENNSLQERFSLRKKLLNKLSHISKEIEGEKFMGKRDFPIDLELPKKCERINLQIFDFYFNNALNAIENDNSNEDNLSFSNNITPIGKCTSEEIELRSKKNKKNNELPNSNDIHKSRIKNKNINKNEELLDEKSCAESVCGNACKIF